MLNSHLEAILGQLRAREPIFHRREFGTSREDLLKDRLPPRDGDQRASFGIVTDHA